MPALPGAPPGLSWPCPLPTARPWLSPGLSAAVSLLMEKGLSWALNPSFLPPPTCQLPSPKPQWARPKCVCVGVGVGLSRESVQRGGGWNSHGPSSPWPGEPRAPFPCSSSVCVAGWLAGASACLCAVGVPMPGGGQQGPLPLWPSLCLCRSPKICTLPVCSGPVVLSVCVCVCFLVLWPVCLCACVALLWSL